MCQQLEQDRLVYSLSANMEARRNRRDEVSAALKTADADADSIHSRTTATVDDITLHTGEKK